MPPPGPAAVTNAGIIEQISASPGGVPKTAQPHGVVRKSGLVGDRQADRRAHGGPNRSLCLFSADVIDALRAAGHDIFAGATGENVTIRGLDWKRVRPGSRLALGDQVRLQVTEYAAPCWKIAGCFRDADFSVVDQQISPGVSRVYARVLEEGPVCQGDRVWLEDDEAVDRLGRLQPTTFRWPPERQS